MEDENLSRCSFSLRLGCHKKHSCLAPGFESLEPLLQVELECRILVINETKGDLRPSGNLHGLDAEIPSELKPA